MALLVRYLHVLAAITWIGGMVFVALVLVPVARGLPDPVLRRRLVHALGIRFRAVGWGAIALLVATGIGNLLARPYLVTTARLQWKLGLVVVALALSAVHDFVLGPRAGREGADPRLRVRAAWIARIELVVVLLIVLLGLALRG